MKSSLPQKPNVKFPYIRLKTSKATRLCDRRLQADARAQRQLYGRTGPAAGDVRQREGMDELSL